MIQMEAQLKNMNVLQTLLVSDKQNRFAMANTINATMKAIQERQRQQIKYDVTVRKTRFILRQVAIIKPFARPQAGRVWSMIRIGHKPRFRLASFEEGAVQSPEFGSNIAVPVIGGARPTKYDSVPRQMWISNLKLKRVVSQLRGTSPMGPVFVISGRGIFTRQGDALKMLYAFKSTQQIERRLHFYAIAVRTAHEMMQPMLQEQITASMSHTMINGIASLTRAAIAGTAVATVLGRFGITEDPEDESDGDSGGDGQ